MEAFYEEGESGGVLSSPSSSPLMYMHAFSLRSLPFSISSPRLSLPLPPFGAEYTYKEKTLLLLLSLPLPSLGRRADGGRREAKA